ncbi:MAG TPA: hypothetical protein VGA13_10540 [Acidimicrobiales bacterium]
MRPTTRLAAVALAAAVAVVLAACGDDSPATAPPQTGGTGAMAAQVASYDLVAGRTGRFIVGLFGSDRTQLVAYGTVGFSFTYLDDGTDDPEALPGSAAVEATFLPIPGQDLDSNQDGPRLVGGSEATGVYGAHNVTFDRPGFWEVTVTATLDGNDEAATSAFEVLADSPIPVVGDRAPATRQALAGDAGVDPKAVDSRATTDRPIPDPELHDLTVADALAARRPFMVVVATPTFCISRFCGPITDSVHELAQRFADRDMAFIHLEVWQDFEAGAVNPAATEWIAPTADTDGREPWVFVVDHAGIITHRFDNVATDAELAAAVEETLA